jgi:dimethylglycine dehydrogenase
MLRFARKSGGYIGADVVELKKQSGVSSHLVYCEVDADDADPIGNEPIFDGGKIVGITTSGAYGHYVKKSLAFAYVDSGYELPESRFEIRILGKQCRAKVLPDSVWDPENQRLRS